MPAQHSIGVLFGQMLPLGARPWSLLPYKCQSHALSAQCLPLPLLPDGEPSLPEYGQWYFVMASIFLCIGSHVSLVYSSLLDPGECRWECSLRLKVELTGCSISSCHQQMALTVSLQDEEGLGQLGHTQGLLGLWNGRHAMGGGCWVPHARVDWAIPCSCACGMGLGRHDGLWSSTACLARVSRTSREQWAGQRRRQVSQISNFASGQ